MSRSRGEQPGRGDATRLSRQRRRGPTRPVVAALPGSVVCVLHARSGSRGLRLIDQASRPVRCAEVHELILTNDADAVPGTRVDGVAYVAFFEAMADGTFQVGDPVRIAGRRIGLIAGFDLTHYPNHLNIVVAADQALKTGLELRVRVGSSVRVGVSRPFLG